MRLLVEARRAREARAAWALILNHPGHGDQKSHGRKGSAGGRVEGRDISGSVDYASLGRRISGRGRHADQDAALAAIQREQGFDGQPTVLSRKDFRQAARSGEVRELHRGVSTEEQAEAFRTGELYAGGVGMYGSGTYAATDLSHAREFGDSTMRIGLRQDARVISYSDLRAEMDAHVGGMKEIADIDRAMVREAESASGIERIGIYARAARRREEVGGPEYAVSQNPGRFAALRGYDAIDIPDGSGGPQMIILNRTAVIVEEAR